MMTNRESIRDIVKFLKKNEKYILPLVLFAGVFSFVSFYTLSANIHGDAKIHTLFVREIVKTGQILDHNPYKILDIKGDKIIYAPVPYPQTSHISMALFYMLGNEEFLKFFSPFLTAVTALFAYLLFRKINIWIGFFGAIFGTVLNMRRFIMVPLIEQFLLFGTVSTIYFYYLFLRKRQMKYIILTSLFLGLTLATKQQGFILFVGILTHGVLFGLFRKIKYKSFDFLKQFVLIVLLTILICVVPLYDQIERNGTIDSVPGNTKIPFMYSKYPVDSASWEVLQSRLGYLFEYKSIFEVLGILLIQPIYYSGSLNIIRTSSLLVNVWIIIFGILFILGYFYLAKEDKKLCSLFLIVFFSNLYMIYHTNTRLWQYHNLFLYLSAITSMCGLFELGKILRKYHRLIIPLVLLILITSGTVGYTTYIQPLYGQSGREKYIKYYKKLCMYVRDNTPRDSIFLTDETSFRYYCERNIIWISAGGGAKIPLIFETNNPNVALKWLKYYNVNYIFINNDQTKWRGSNDYIPPHGLLDYIDCLPYFEKVYEVPLENPKLILYKVCYPLKD